MKSLLAVAAVVILAVVAFNRALGPGASADTPVAVHSAQAVKAILPADPDSGTISGYVYAALVEAAKNASGTMASDLRAMAGDSELLDGIATSGATRFASNQAAALAYPLYRVTVTVDLVSITTTTVELLPQHWNLGRSIAHEDGHATINRLLAEECASGLVALHGGAGKRGALLEIAIQNALYELGDDAHGRYHGVVNGASSPPYARAARQAAEDTIAAKC